MQRIIRTRGFPMSQDATNPKVDAILAKAKKWQAEMLALRAIAQECPLVEDVKWGQPCYTLDGTNVVLIHAFKDYCALLFMKGALLKNASGLLIQQTENVQSARQIRFTSLDDIKKQKKLVKAHILEAIEIEKAGLKVAFKKPTDYEVPEELHHVFDQDTAFKEAFYALTPGRQRSYLLHFSTAKQSKTRTARIEKSKSTVFEGRGHNEM